MFLSEVSSPFLCPLPRGNCYYTLGSLWPYMIRVTIITAEYVAVFLHATPTLSNLSGILAFSSHSPLLPHEMVIVILILQMRAWRHQDIK